MHRYLLFLLLCLSFRTYSQSNCDCFDRLYQLANNQTDDQKGIEIFKDALTFLDTNRRGEYYWELGKWYMSIKQYDSSVAWYEKAIEWGYDLDFVKAYLPEVYTRMDTNRMNAVFFEHRKRTNFTLYERFVAQLTIDQSVRNNLLFSNDKYRDTTTPACERAFADTMFQRVDDSTFRFLKWVFENYGFPTFRQLGFHPGGIMAMIMHVTGYKNEQAAYLFNKLDELSNQCQLQKSSILVIRERQKYANEKKSCCGLYGPGQRYLAIEDPSKTDSIRFAYNQLRLKDEASYWNGKLPPGYKPRPYPKNYFCLKKYNIE